MNNDAPLVLIQEIVLEDNSITIDNHRIIQGRFDHFSIDIERKQLLLSCLGHGSLLKIDYFGGLCAGCLHLPDNEKYPQGVYYCSDNDTIYVATASGKVLICVGDSLYFHDCIDFEDEADNLRYDETKKLLFVGYGDGAIDAIDIETNKRLNLNYKLNAHPESFQLDPNGSYIYVNVADTKSIAIINRTNSTVQYYSLPANLSANFPMAFDSYSNHLLIGCRKPNPHLLVLDVSTLSSIEVVQTIKCKGDMDDIFFDNKRQMVYVISGEGFIEVFQKGTTEPNLFNSISCISTGSIGARTGFFFDRRDAVYVAAPRTSISPSKLLVFEARSPE